ncbi:extracellular solute-binding protein [Microbulbifer hydrolyticus]|uniref:Putrescine-binding periplasmic protein n=1 Tax=Microbulbifer hydrolyticus TaxID=48074 RepID=A0A6P1T9A5_9GAMM|nr:extracellular solute-binding protein [Microbulbifer hydrolyticus]MBB5211044.1 putrescine transport system substrate-binding protein [Microbulbifer hydrolyticus]QHQ38156.1 extracellular solute-binding protein [Microbulbifer hydrolyticus]
MRPIAIVWVTLTAFFGLSLGTVSAQAEELHFANWSESIAEDTIADFEAATGIKVHYFEFDDIEELEEVWLKEGRRFDIIVPGSDNIPKYIAAGQLQKLDRNRIDNWSQNDPKFMQRLALFDPQNEYAIPYLWGTVGIGYNVQAVEKAFGGALPEDSWNLLFDPENLGKLDHCNATLMRSPEEIFDVALKYLGKDPNSMSTAHQYMVANLLSKVRLHITDFDSGEYVEDLASGKRCIAHAWSGDVLVAQQMAKEAGNTFDIRYIMPREGFPLWIDVVSMPANAQNTDAAYQFLNYLMQPSVIANISNETQYANANMAAQELVAPELLNNPIVYPGPDEIERTWIPAATKSQVLALRHKLWQRIIEREGL